MILRKYWKPILFVSLLLAANIFAGNSERVEKFYSNGVYPVIVMVFQYLLGWIPFSIGDLFYLTIIGGSTYGLIRFFRGLRKAECKWKHVLKGVSRLAYAICVLWIWFQVAWGFNYNRESIPKRYQLERSPVRDSEIDSFAVMMLDQVQRTAAHRGSDSSLNRKALAKEKDTKVKSSLFGVIGNYMGYSGYYNPFTGEAQINTHMPAFTLPFTAAHEAAHQLGHAKESDANFIGFLTARESNDSALLYSAHLEMFLYAHAAIRHKDSTRAKQLFEALPAAAKRDIDSYRAFLKKYQGPIDQATTWFYTRFLRFNNQPEGMRSYDRGMVYIMRWISKKS